MAVPGEPHAEGSSASSETSVGAATAGRRLPFTLRVAAVWTSVTDLDEAGGHVGYWARAPLTGRIIATGGRGDVSFSDVEIR
jgi:hypothetical protein